MFSISVSVSPVWCVQSVSQCHSLTHISPSWSDDLANLCDRFILSRVVNNKYSPDVRASRSTLSQSSDLLPVGLKELVSPIRLSGWLMVYPELDFVIALLAVYSTFYSITYFHNVCVWNNFAQNVTFDIFLLWTIIEINGCKSKAFTRRTRPSNDWSKRLILLTHFVLS